MPFIAGLGEKRINQRQKKQEQTIDGNIKQVYG
jgi:hypothetical protein